MIQVNGLSFTHTHDAKFGSRVQIVLVGGKPLDARQRYQIATSSMLADGGHNYQAFTRGVDRHEIAAQYEVIEGALRQRKRVVTPPFGRIRAASQPSVTK